MSEPPVLAVDRYATNAGLIVAAHRLGYLRDDDLTLDATYGQGVWWRSWRPERLLRHDINPEKAPDGPVDFCHLPYRDQAFDAVAFDGPYRLNGRPDPAFDRPYGTDKRARWQDRMELLVDGAVECARVTRRHLLVKCQDQVVSGAVRWQTRILADEVEAQHFDLVDRLDFLSYRPQPLSDVCRTCQGIGVLGDLGRCGACEGTGEVPRRQVHARRNISTLLVFERQGVARQR